MLWVVVGSLCGDGVGLAKCSFLELGVEGAKGDESIGCCTVAD